MDNKKIQYIKLHIYILALVITAVALGWIFYNKQVISLPQIIFWSVIAGVAESMLITLDNGAGVSVGFAVSVAAIIVLGPFKAAVVGALGIAFRIVDVGKKHKQHILNTDIKKTIFNVSQLFICTLLSGHIYLVTGGVINSVTLPQVIFIIPVYITLNCLFIWGLMSIILDKKGYVVWKSTLVNIIYNCTLVGLIGIIMALVAIKINIYAIILFFGPLLIARYSYKQYTSLRDTYLETINAFNKTLEAKDPYTSGHSQRVQKYSEKLAEAMGLSGKRIKNISDAAILHDIGKIGIDDSILKKQGALTKEEFTVIKKHSEIGADILKDVDFLSDVSRIIRSHHERYDGKGYPDGLKGDDIPVESSILAIADAYDAMTSDRPYRAALSKEEALVEIKKNAGMQFSVDIADKFSQLMEEK